MFRSFEITGNETLTIVLSNGVNIAAKDVMKDTIYKYLLSVCKIIRLIMFFKYIANKFKFKYFAIMIIFALNITFNIK
jgi:hypothetical protein